MPLNRWDKFIWAILELAMTTAGTVRTAAHHFEPNKTELDYSSQERV